MRVDGGIVDFAAYQTASADYSDPSDVAHELIPLLGLGAHIGALLSAHQRYLRDAILAGASTSLVARELGEVLRWCALLADHYEIDLGDVAERNLEKVDNRSRSLGHQGIDGIGKDARELRAYQQLSAQTDQQALDGLDPLSLSVPMLGLAGEIGSLLVEIKKKYRGDEIQHDWQDFVAGEIGDLLWYLAAVATHMGLDLEEIAQGDLKRARQSKASVDLIESGIDLPILDSDYPLTERFPRKIVLRFQESRLSGGPLVTMTLIDAAPNPFPDGPVEVASGKAQGFAVGAQIGDRVTNNSKVDDAYRYHDAVHLGFMAVMGWSPNLRGLFRLKRKSDPAVDENEDGARAIFAEEGLAALLAKRASDSQWFANPRLVSEEIVEMMVVVLEDLEVHQMPPWLWRQSISQGFGVMRKLVDGRGGYVLADLDARHLTYSKVPPRLV
jgi:NTP pyrophosphatase (non-canonical NTP hydrolase)